MSTSDDRWKPMPGSGVEPDRRLLDAPDPLYVIAPDGRGAWVWGCTLCPAHGENHWSFQVMRQIADQHVLFVHPEHGKFEEERLGATQDAADAALIDEEPEYAALREDLDLPGVPEGE